MRLPQRYNSDAYNIRNEDKCYTDRLKKRLMAKSRNFVMFCNLICVYFCPLLIHEYKISCNKIAPFTQENRYIKTFSAFAKNKFSSHIYFVVCRCFRFGQVQDFCRLLPSLVGQWVAHLIRDLGPYSPTILKNILRLFLQDLQIEM